MKCSSSFDDGTSQCDDRTDITPHPEVPERSLCSAGATERADHDSTKAPPVHKLHMVRKRKYIPNTIDAPQVITSGVRTAIETPRKKQKKVAEGPRTRPTTPDDVAAPITPHTISHSPGWVPLNCCCALPFLSPAQGRLSIQSADGKSFRQPE